MEKDQEGNIYSGSFENGARDGFGSMKYIDGALYIGKWVKGDIHGFGHYTWNASK